MQDDLNSLYAFNRWADQRILEKVRLLSFEQYTQEPVPGWSSVRATLVHVAGATLIWARRLEGELITARPTEDEYPSLADVEQLLTKGHAAFGRLLTTLTPERLNTIWSYRNLSGQECRTPLWAVYRHVVNHATYHRGQIASKLGRFGIDPPFTDLVFWATEQTPQS